MDKSVLSIILSGGRLKGRVFFLDKQGLTSDDLMFGEIVANMMATRMDGVDLLKHLQDVAAAEERVQIARDVHDSLLQSLPAIALQLENARRLLIEQPQAGMERVAHIQRQVEAEQHNLRAIFRDLQTPRPAPDKEQDALSLLLDDLVTSLKQRWDVQVELRLDQNGRGIPARMHREIYSIVWEAVVNAARHGRASIVGVQIRSDHGSVSIDVRDNGCGFYFRGFYDHAALMKMKLGPETLKERIAPLGGSLSIESSESGARVEIDLPIGLGGLDVH
jgi:signal transduction histidine kinase